MDLHAAVWAGDGARFRDLLELGSDVDDPDDWGHPALFVACLSEVTNLAVVAVLREHGADPYHGKAYKRTPRAQAYDPLSPQRCRCPQRSAATGAVENGGG